MRDSITLTVHYGSAARHVRVDRRSGSRSRVARRTSSSTSSARATRGAFTVAVTNDAGSELAHGRRRGHPARGRGRARRRRDEDVRQHARRAGAPRRPRRRPGRRSWPTASRRSPTSSRRAARAGARDARRSRSRSRTSAGCSSIGRGVEFATAREIALKLLETCRIAAEPLTATDLAHGPVAALDPLFPVWAIASRRRHAGARAGGRDAGRARWARRSSRAAPRPTRSTGAAYALPVPTPGLALLSPLLSVVPGQLFAWALARARGLDADAPHGLAKVTLAR